MYKRIVLLLAASAAATAAAQQPQRPDPGDPKARVPAVEHRSAFQSYRRYSEPEISGWREMNEEVRRIGGHVGIVREQPHPVKPGVKPGPEAGHGGHK